jgi:hypothetical protein
MQLLWFILTAVVVTLQLLHLPICGRFQLVNDLGFIGVASVSLFPTDALFMSAATHETNIF